MRLTLDFDYRKIRNMIQGSSLETGIYVGCDSQVRGKSTDFVTVIIIHIDSRHGARIFHDTNRIERRLSLRERLWKEVELASLAALALEDSVGSRPFSVHLDLNTDPKHRSNVVTREAIAYIRALGLEPVVKPDAFAATHAADHIVHREHL